MVLAGNFFLCVLSCFFDLGLDSAVGCVQKRTEKVRKEQKRMQKY
jgi:hypothetical protein